MIRFTGQIAPRHAVSEFTLNLDVTPTLHFYDPVDAWELYEMKKDKNEMHNLYSDPAYKRVVTELKKRLQDLQAYYKDDTAHLC